MNNEKFKDAKRTNFVVGDKVKVTDTLLSKLPYIANRLKGGGVIIKVLEGEAEVKFYSTHTYYISLSSLRLSPTKNQQLLFNFMDQL